MNQIQAFWNQTICECKEQTELQTLVCTFLQKPTIERSVQVLHDKKEWVVQTIVPRQPFWLLLEVPFHHPHQSIESLTEPQVWKVLASIRYPCKGGVELWDKVTDWSKFQTLLTYAQKQTALLSTHLLYLRTALAMLQVDVCGAAHLLVQLSPFAQLLAILFWSTYSKEVVKQWVQAVQLQVSSNPSLLVPLLSLLYQACVLAHPTLVQDYSLWHNASIQHLWMRGYEQAQRYPTTTVAWKTLHASKDELETCLQQSFVMCEYPFFYPKKLESFRYTCATTQRYHSTVELINVSRTELLQDIFYATQNHDRWLGKLKVTFWKEQAIDGGGVCREFFHLLSKEFTRMFGAWLYPCVQSDQLKELESVGKMLALALYNNMLLDLAFPPIFYQLLVWGKTRPLSLDDLEEVEPVVARSLRQVLQMKQVEELELTFCRMQDVYGKAQPLLLKADGDQCLVTKDNVVEYVDGMVQSYLFDGFQLEWEALRKGFQSVLHKDLYVLLPTLTKQELQQWFCGMPKTVYLDFEILEKRVQYVGFPEPGFQRVMNYFWKIVKFEFTQVQKHKLLLFVTGSDKLPQGGLNELPFRIQYAGNVHTLPSARTCYNTLFLHLNYDSKRVLKRHLLIVLEHCVGFGFV